MALAACQPAPPEERITVEVFRPDYRGAETSTLAPDLLRLDVAMAGARDGRDVTDYADCAAAQYAASRGFGFLRHVRTNLDAPGGLEGGVWRADAVYTVSPDLPRGLKTIDAGERVAECRRRGIPTV